MMQLLKTNCLFFSKLQRPFVFLLVLYQTTFFKTTKYSKHSFVTSPNKVLLVIKHVPACCIPPNASASFISRPWQNSFLTNELSLFGES